MAVDDYSIDGVTVAPGTRGHAQLQVAKGLIGTNLELPVIIVHGQRPGPTLLITALVHGGEHFPIQVLSAFLPRLDAAELAGTVLVVPVSNPPAFATGTRLVMEDDIDFANLNRVFPGVRSSPAFGSGTSHPRDRSLAERIADVLASQLMARADFVLDMHAGPDGIGIGKMMRRATLPSDQMAHVEKMAKAVGLGLIHEHDAGSNNLTGLAADRGIPAVVFELGPGAAVGRDVQERVARRGADGLENVLRALEMLPGTAAEAGPQYVHGHAPHVRPVSGGYLISLADPARQFAGEALQIAVEEGDLLGSVVDPARLEVIEEIRSPCKGLVYFTRQSGPIQPGGHAYAVADLADGRWER